MVERSCAVQVTGRREWAPYLWESALGEDADGRAWSALIDTFGVPCEAADGNFGLTSINRSFRKHRLQR